MRSDQKTAQENKSGGEETREGRRERGICGKKKQQKGREVEQEQGHEGKLFLCKKPPQRACCNVAGGNVSLHN